VAETLEVEPPVALPRWSATLIEPHITRLLDSYGMRPADLAAPHAAETALARRAWPPRLAEAIARLRTEAGHLSPGLRRALAENADLVPPAIADGFQRTLEWRIQRLERRVNAAVKKREQRAMQDVATMRAALYPNGIRQERALNIIPTLARQGLTLLDQMGDSAAEHARGLLGARMARATAQ
jgi:uncharacterized protein YllA (UPF0747 family)